MHHHSHCEESRQGRRGNPASPVIPGSESSVIPGSESPVIPGSESSVIPGSESPVIPGSDPGSIFNRGFRIKSGMTIA